MYLHLHTPSQGTDYGCHEKHTAVLLSMGYCTVPLFLFLHHKRQPLFQRSCSNLISDHNFGNTLCVTIDVGHTGFMMNG